ncbi:MAG: GGDEF domain-containing protein [Syntrophomonadaceae bacterium]|nr:GGDEF domain-containing protein [Syntrophomonadaceae bacterium]
MLICSIYNGWRRYTWLVILFAVIGVLMYIEYTYPALINTYTSRDARYLDVYTSNFIAMMSITMIFIIYANSYRKEHEYVKNYAERLEKIAVTDGLTGLYNHNHLYSCLKQEIYKAERYKRFLSLIMIDSDYFKQVNDTYGHPTGDLVLKQFVNILRSNTRTSDIIGRYGGDEFLIVCPETNLENTVSITEKLRAIVEDASFGESGQIKMTISCGITTWEGESLSQIIKQVDQALYAAKNAGRNRVEIYKDKSFLTDLTPSI